MISGRGSNLQALIDACAAGTLDAEIVAVVSNRAEAYGLERAGRRGITTIVRRLAEAPSRPDYDRSLARELVDELRPDLIVLAGWMHILGPAFLELMDGTPVLNLHPALPGAFPGLDAIARAWDAWQRGDIAQTGVMVHHVVAEVDAGEVVAQAAVGFEGIDDLEGLEARIHAAEHRVIVEAVAKVIDDTRR